MKINAVKNLTLSAMFLALGIILPFFTGQIPEIGSMLLPMHIPVFLCALVCGYQYGVVIGVILPLLRSFLFSRPNFYPEAIAIALEMATYAFLAGFIYGNSKWKCIKSLYLCLGISMVGGRMVRGVIQWVLLKFIGVNFTLKAFIYGVVITAMPGIILQLFLIPLVMVILNRTKLFTFTKAKNKEQIK